MKTKKNSHLITVLLACLFVVLVTVLSALGRGLSQESASAPVSSAQQNSAVQQNSAGSVSSGTVSSGGPFVPANEGSTVSAEIDFTVTDAGTTLALGSYKEQYDKLVEAVTGYEASYTFPSEAAMQTVLQNLSAFPLAPLAQIQAKTGTADTVSITYTLSKEDFAQKLQEYTDICKDMIYERVFESCNELEKTLILYKYLCGNVNYADGQSDIYTALTQYTADAAGYCRALNFLLGQLGITCSVDSGSFAGEPHSWLTVSFFGESYHLDPTLENGSTGGKGLFCFGLSDSGLTDKGVVFDTDYPLACTSENLAHAVGNAMSWKLDSTGHMLYLYDLQGNHIGSISTQTLAAAAG